MNIANPLCGIAASRPDYEGTPPVHSEDVVSETKPISTDTASIDKDRQKMLEELERELTRLPGEDVSIKQEQSSEKQVPNSNVPVDASSREELQTVDPDASVIAAKPREPENKDEQSVVSGTKPEPTAKSPKPQPQDQKLNISEKDDDVFLTKTPARSVDDTASSEDFYSKYKCQSSSVTSPYEDLSIEDAIEQAPRQQKAEGGSMEMMDAGRRKSPEEEAATHIATGR